MSLDHQRQDVETDKQTLKEGVTLVELWLRKIKRAQDDEEAWRKDAKEAIDIYEAGDKSNPAFNILNSNVDTLLPAVYNSTPVPDVRRRFGDADPIAKQVVDVEERMLSYSVDQYDIDDEFEAVVRDALVSGRGVARVRYRPHTTQGVVGYQEATCERVPWDKFIRGPAASWRKTPWVAFEHDYTREQLLQVSADKGKLVDLGDGGKDSDGDKDVLASGVMKTAKVFEIWDKPKRRVLFIAESFKSEPLAIHDDPMGLQDFFPVLKPIHPQRRVSSMVPVCPYKILKPLIDELDTITKRISKLVKQLKVRGVYWSDLEQDFERVTGLEDGQFIASKNAGAFVSSGGIDKTIWVWPIEPIVKALQQLYVQRNEIKQTIYEVSGLSDIMRGASDPSETLGAQEIKQQWGSIKVQTLQRRVQGAARELFRAKVALFAKHWTDENIRLMTALPATDEQAQIWPQVMQLFRSDGSNFRVDIETDSTIRADLTRNQQTMNNFLTGTAQFATSVGGVVQSMPQYANQTLPVLVEVYTAFARQHKLGKQAEDALDKLSTIAQQLSQQPQEDKPDPAAQKAEAEMQVMQAKAQMEAQTKQADLQSNMQMKQLEMAHAERMAELAERKAMMELQVKQAELDLKRQEMELKAQSMQMDQAAKAREMELKEESQELDREAMYDAREHEAESSAIKLDAMRKSAAAKTNGREARS